MKKIVVAVNQEYVNTAALVTKIANAVANQKLKKNNLISYTLKNSSYGESFLFLLILFAMI